MDFARRGRVHRDEKLYHRFPLLTGPDLIHRGVDISNSFSEILDYLDRGFPNGFNPTLGGGRIAVEALERDPFGLTNFSVFYSLNKRKRWLIPDQLNDIEALQDPSVGLKVSTFELALDPIYNWLLCSMRGHANNIFDNPTVRVNTVDDRGNGVHREGNVNSTGRDLFMSPNPPRHRRGRRIKGSCKPNRIENRPSEADLLPWERNVHAVYIVTRPFRSKNCINKSIRRACGRGDRRWKDEERPWCSRELLAECCIDMEDSEESEVEICESRRREPMEADLNDLVVVKRARKKRRRVKTKLLDYGSPVKVERSESFEEIGDEPESPAPVIPPLSIFSPPPHFASRQQVSLAATFLPPTEIYRAGDAVILRQGAGCWINRLEADSRAPKKPPHRDFCIEGALRAADVGKAVPFDPCRPETGELTAPELDYCTVCFCMEAGGFALPCGHFFCFDCWRQRFSTGIHRNLVPVTCMERGCAAELDPEVALCFVPQRFVLRYRELLRKALLRDPTRLSCWRCCEMLQVEDYGIAKCPCGALNCAKCNGSAHPPINCEENAKYDDLLRRNGQTLSKVTTSHSAAGMMCPRCRQLISRTLGCISVRCVCGTTFCYGCGHTFDSIDHGGCAQLAEKQWSLVDADSRKMDTVPSSLFDTVAEIRNLKTYDSLKGPKTKFPAINIRNFVEMVDFCERALIGLFYRTQRRYPRKDDCRHKAARAAVHRLAHVLKRRAYDAETLQVALRICTDVHGFFGIL